MRRLPGPDDLWFLPLGGTGEIGMNLNLYGHDGAWLMVDLGVTFADERLPGVDLIMPDPSFIEERRDKLAGLVLTHAHEDHIGAVPHIWPRLECPIYATPFTAGVLYRKLAEVGIDGDEVISEVPLSGRFEVGPFEIELITLTHSIPEPNALVIRTPAGTVLHTGDWKLDPDPLVGDDYDEAALRRLAEEGVIAMICDSTNALVEGESGSEAEVRKNLAEVIGALEGRVAVACFATNVARVETVMKVAALHGRRVALFGRSMYRIYDAAREAGYLTDVPPPIAEDDVGYLPRHEVLLLCTGSQGETRAALWRIARDEHPEVSLEPGDAVVFSSRVIPGNEKSISALQNELVRQGVKVITDHDHPIHVSGHPARNELAQMYQWVRPRVAIPVHGEARHLAEHAELAKACQVPQAMVAENGHLIALAPGNAKVLDNVPTGRLVLDGNRLMPADSPVLRGRQKIGYNGVATLTLVVDAKGNALAEPRLSMQGVIDPDREATVLDGVMGALIDELARMPRGARASDTRLSEAARVAVRRAVFRAIGKKPVTQVHLVRL
ncbi:MAG: ribonuclease J [Rhodospirillales bacterium]|nr:ribonuclease J [Rhodospirillales bacterium]